ncbi:MAG: hypothetical protein KFF68_18055 [Desulfosarcina sp.]|nr:hypothetical protein [Desulfosarcina sp.]
MWPGERRTRTPIVDDENGFRESLGRRLEKRGAVVNQAADGQAALESMTKAFTLSELAVEVIELTRKTASECQSEVSAACEVKGMCVWSDLFQIRQVLINWVTNGLQAVSKGGRVELIITGNDGEAITVVCDNDPGIPSENLERIFEPFFTAKPPGGRNGIGPIRIARDYPEIGRPDRGRQQIGRRSDVQGHPAQKNESAGRSLI